MSPSITLYIVYDNNPSSNSLRAEWGLSVFVYGLKETILFDAGGSATVLRANMRTLGISRDMIDIFVLSHMHRDHFGGLDAVLRKGQRCYLPASATEMFIRKVKAGGATVVKDKKAVQVQPHVTTTGTFGGTVPEQGLLIETTGGRLLLTGCAHPGIDAMVKTLADHNRLPAIIVGGLHLTRAPEQKIRNIAQSLKRMGVKRIGPCHCSGNSARAIFKEVFETGYIETHVGAKITL